MNDELVGYEIEVPWFQGLFPGNTTTARFCLECFQPQPKLNPVKILTRQKVEAEVKALREQGIAHNGPTVFWQGLEEEQCWNCGKNLVTGKKPKERQIDKVSFVRRIPYQLRHTFARNPDLLKSAYSDMTEQERAEVVAYITRHQRTKRSYHDMGTEDRLAATENLLQRWSDLSERIDNSNDCLLTEQAQKELAKLVKDSNRYFEETRDKETRRKPRRFKVAHEHPEPLTTEYLERLEKLVLGVISMEDERLADEPCPFCGAREVPDEDGGSSIDHEANCLGSLAFDLAEYGGLIEEYDGDEEAE